MRNLPLAIVFVLAVACSSTSKNATQDNEASNEAPNTDVPTGLERLQQGDKTLCADKDTLIGVSSVLADMSNARDGFNRMTSKSENLDYQFISATAYNKDVPELSCSGTLTLRSFDGPMKALISWKLRPNLSNPGSAIVEVEVPTDVAHAFWLTMVDEYPDPKSRLSLSPAPAPAPENTAMEPDDTPIQNDSSASLDYTNNNAE